MTDIALFHSVLGVRPGVHDAAELLRAAGHAVTTVDQYDGRVFDDYEEASGFAESIGYPALMQRALEAVAELPDGFVAAGFSNGGGMAEYVATQGRVAGAVLLARRCARQVHYTVNDPFRRQEWIDAVVGAVRAAAAPVETFDYPGGGHLFTDASLPAEYDPGAAALLWTRVLAFCAER